MVDKTAGVLEGLGGKEDKKAIEEVISKKEKKLDDWVPKTESGKLVRNGEIGSLDDFFAKGLKVFEPEVVDFLSRDMEEKMIEFKKTARVTRSGRVFSFRAAVLVGDKNRYVGLGIGKDKERFPALRKATKNAKLSLVKIMRGCGSWECGCSETHSVPFRVEGKSSSVRVVLIPAPKGTGLVVGKNIKDVLVFAGVRDVWSKTFGNTASKLDFVKATIKALTGTGKVKLSKDIEAKMMGAK
ncbi:MAG: 30S ribosomal protein S5 [Candidatus Diapherotrites archaeon]|nr:30S ribosomal protein S5 [Candidatus Diapherotrites archaeon]